MKLYGSGWGGQGRDEQVGVPDGRRSLKERWEEQQARERSRAEEARRRSERLDSKAIQDGAKR